MLRRSLTFIVALAVSTTLSCTLITAPLNAAQQQGEKQDPRNQSQTAQRAAKPAPVIPAPDPSPYTGEETRKYNAETLSTQQQIAADTQRMASYTRTLVWIGGGIGVLEILLLLFQAVYTGKAATAAQTSAEAVKLSSRAVITLSHHPPGIVIQPFEEPGEEPMRRINLSVGVQNFGATPGRITYALLQPCFLQNPLPRDPPYDEAFGQPMGGVAVKNDSFNINRGWTISAAKLKTAKSIGNILSTNPLVLAIIGYVDYIDEFGVRRRSGYGRYYDPNIDSKSNYELLPGKIDRLAYTRRNNLPIITDVGYNYDRPRHMGQGNDWSEG